jgi:hypothetical protein
LHSCCTKARIPRKGEVNVVFACGNSMAGDALVSGIPMDLVIGVAIAVGGSALLVSAAFLAALIGGIVVWART